MSLHYNIFKLGLGWFKKRNDQFRECLGVGVQFTVPFADRVMKIVSLEEQFISISRSVSS